MDATYTDTIAIGSKSLGGSGYYTAEQAETGTSITVEALLNTIAVSGWRDHNTLDSTLAELLFEETLEVSIDSVAAESVSLSESITLTSSANVSLTLSYRGSTDFETFDVDTTLAYPSITGFNTGSDSLYVGGTLSYEMQRVTASGTELELNASDVMAEFETSNGGHVEGVRVDVEQVDGTTVKITLSVPNPGSSYTVSG